MTRPVTLRSVRADWLRVQSDFAALKMRSAGERYRAALLRDERNNPYHDEAGRFTSAEGQARSNGRHVVQAGLPIKQVIDLAARGFGKLMQLGRRLLKVPQKFEKLPDYLKSRPGAGKIIGDLKALTPQELRFVEKLRQEGHEVEIVSRDLGKTPDFKINGVASEFKDLSNVVANTSEGISKAVSRTIYKARKQAPNIIINAEKQAGMTEDVARETIMRAFGKDSRRILKSITIYTRSGPVHRMR